MLAAALGACTPPVAACLRAALPDVVADPGQLRSVISLQATLSEFAWIAGPPLTLGVAAVVSTRAALLVAAGGLLLGTAAFAREPASRAWRPAVERAASRGALAAPGMRTLTIVLTAVGVVFGAVEVGVATGQGAGAGPLLGLWGAGSLLGGAAATRLGGGARTPGGLAGVLAALAAGHLALALAGGSAMALGVLLVVAGAAIAPTYATVYAMVDDIAPEGHAHRGVRVARHRSRRGRGAGVGVRRRRDRERRDHRCVHPGGRRRRARRRDHARAGRYARRMFLPGDIDEVARGYGLGADPRLTGTVERGEQGQVWQLETELGLWAIKTSFELAEEELDGEDAAFQMAAQGAGVPVPAVVLTGAGDVFAKVGDTHVRVYRWVDIGPPDKRLDPGEVGRLVAAMHRVPFTGRRPEDPVVHRAGRRTGVGSPHRGAHRRRCTVRGRHGGDA